MIFLRHLVLVSYSILTNSYLHNIKNWESIMSFLLNWLIKKMWYKYISYNNFVIFFRHLILINYSILTKFYLYIKKLNNKIK